ncbi:MAG: peptidyl-prolyl cis-trans isomerase [Spirochaetaceae bacterium]|jgi:parvulin-like peptidyl-prolyl isomerase|nr:peptidyl-prolyl cis-trans isomerase [Spirochaetaceae bacterium]
MKRVVSAVWFGLVAAALGFAQTDLQPAAIVRLTKSEPISVKQLRTEVELMEKQSGKVLTAAERRQVLDVMINERLAIQAAERDKVTLSENEINQQIQQLRSILVQQLGRQPTDAEFALAVRNETGLEVPAFREQLRRQLLVQKYLQFKKGTLLSSIKTPTEAEILNTYNLAKTNFVRPETIRFSMIMVPFGSDKNKARDLANRLIQEIGSNPSKFDEAVVKGQSPTAGYKAGDGGYLPRMIQAQQAVGPEFMNTAFALKQGEVSKAIETPQGYVIIKVTETHIQKNLDLDDIFQLGTRMTVRDYIGNMLMQQQQQEVLKKASDELIEELRRGNPFQIMENNLKW